MATGAGIIVAANRKAHLAFGYGSGEMEGRNVTMLMPPYFAANHDGYLARRKRAVGLSTIVDRVDDHAVAAQNTRDTIGKYQIILYQQHMHYRVRHEKVPYCARGSAEGLTGGIISAALS